MVYNGEIFNYIELREELQRLGHHFNTQSDAEVLLAAFAHWDANCFERLNGMWAVVIYDAVKQQLTLSRDRFGIKPLYYAIVNHTLYFGSEVKFLLSFLPSLEINEARAMEYLVQNVVDHHEETLFEQVYQLLPATYAVFNRRGLVKHTYWHLPQNQVRLSLSEASQRYG
jgi:asparagine synthase (glutamine-hydrolysing)